MILYRKILELHDEGISLRGISTSTGNSRQKVTDVIELAKKKGLMCPLEEEMDDRWNGGVTPENQKIRHSKEYIQWRDSVYERDDFTCQCCGDNKGGNLNAHHIENFAEHEGKRFDISNGITLCNDCHNPNVEGSFHHTYGTRNNNREQLEEYIKSKQLLLLNV